MPVVIHELGMSVNLFLAVLNGNITYHSVPTSEVSTAWKSEKIEQR